MLVSSGVKIENTRSKPTPTAKPSSDWEFLLPHLQQIAEDENCDVNTYVQQHYHARRRPIITKILHAFSTTRNPQNLQHILFNLSERGVIENTYVLRCVASVANHYKDRLRDIESWSVNTQNRRQQSSQLLRHMFSEFEIPLFMDSVWHKGGTLQQEWYKHLGSGKNLRTAKGLPIQITKKIAHYFGEAPSHYTVPEALRFAQAKAVGGDRRLAEAIRRTRLVHTFTDDPFWMSFLRFLSSHLSELDPRDINRLVEYIYDIRFVPRRILIAGGGERQVSPPQPRFHLKGKCLKTLLANAEAWEQARHEDTEDRVVGFEWSPSKIAPFQFQCDDGLWSFRELLSSSELVSEGNALQHCVGEVEYAEACFAGETTIWSLSSSDPGTGERENLLTIEVDIEENNITEMRGYQNRLPTPKERGIVRIWSILNEITDTGNLLGGRARIGVRRGDRPGVVLWG